MKRYFLTGVFVLLPLAATVVIIVWLFNLLDSWAVPFTQRLFGHHIPGLGLVVTLAVIVSVGVFSSNVIGRYFLKMLDTLIMDMPVFRGIYNTTKQVMQIFSPQSQDAFHSVVLVEHPRTGSLSLGFVTRESHVSIKGQKERHVAVYVPTNHLYFGDIYLFKPEHVHTTSLSIQEGIQSVISAGATLRPTFPRSPTPPAIIKNSRLTMDRASADPGQGKLSGRSRLCPADEAARSSESFPTRRLADRRFHSQKSETRSEKR